MERKSDLTKNSLDIAIENNNYSEKNNNNNNNNNNNKNYSEANVVCLLLLFRWIDAVWYSSHVIRNCIHPDPLFVSYHTYAE